MQSAFKLSWMGAAKIQDDRLRQHGDVLNAIRDGDPVLASRNMEALLDTAIIDLRDALNRRAQVSQN